MTARQLTGTACPLPRGSLVFLCLWVASLTVGLDVVYEFKPYDLMALAGLAVFGGQLAAIVRDPDGLDAWTIVFFCMAGVFGGLVTFVRTDSFWWMGVIGLRVYRLFSYLFLFLLLRRLDLSARDLSALLHVVILCVCTQAVLILLQYFGIAPVLWSAREQYYRTLQPSGTLGLNHLNSVLFMSVGIAAALGRYFLRRARGSFAGVSTSLLLVVMVAAMLVGEARSAIFALGVLGVVLFRRIRGVTILAVAAALAIGLGMLTRLDVVDLSQSLWEKRIGSRIDERYDSIHRFYDLETARPAIWKRTGRKLLERPDLLVMGTGFQNFAALDVGAVAGHNTYLHVVAELGILGGVLYLVWLRSIWRSLTVDAAEHDSDLLTEIAWAGLVCFATVMGLALFNETLYPSRALPGFMGFALSLLAICGHRGWAEPGTDAEGYS